ncbi:MAG TPA: hypothetical protein VLE74_02100 [Candidatus Saccharimonadales bacterium]|nr:hypothetical protein [Candidatus Saccharimonadales bacterium]
MKPALLGIATTLSVVGTTDYVLSILKGTTRPHRTTRVVLFIVSVANLVGTIAAHAGLGVLLLSLLFFGRSLLLALLSIKRGIGGTSRLDISCAIIAVLGILAWQVTGSGIWALAFAILADAVAYIPAVLKTWKLPKSEAPLMYWLEGIAATLAIVHDGLRSSVIFQAYIVLSCVVMLFCIYRPTFGKERIST